MLCTLGVRHKVVLNVENIMLNVNHQCELSFYVELCEIMSQLEKFGSTNIYSLQAVTDIVASFVRSSEQ